MLLLAWLLSAAAHIHRDPASVSLDGQCPIRDNRGKHLTTKLQCGTQVKWGDYGDLCTGDGVAGSVYLTQLNPSTCKHNVCHSQLSEQVERKREADEGGCRRIGGRSLKLSNCLL